MLSMSFIIYCLILILSVAVVGTVIGSLVIGMFIMYEKIDKIAKENNLYKRYKEWKFGTWNMVPYFFFNLD